MFVELDFDNLDKVLEQNEKTLVMYGAAWCGNCKLLKPEIAWPDVQPPAYLAPKPTKSPPIANINNPFRSEKTVLSNNSEGK